MSHRIVNYLWATLLIILSGCAHQPDIRSAQHKQAIAWANQGEKAYLRGNVEQSRQYYEKALQISTSIENEHGIAANTLSLTQINLDRGEYDQAEIKLQFILGDKNHFFESSDKADAAARSAQLALLLKQPGKAAELAQQAQLLCKEAGYSLGAAILNLHAQAALALGHTEESTDWARQAGAIAEKVQQPVELANSRRLLGEIQLRQKLAAAAIPLLEQALLLDKQLGLAKKIAEDLHFLADAKDMLGQHDEAESCRSRERAIRMALGEKGP
jgi:tetratricopeptide (TPR) repeat protein